jgi:hypothetical protein
LTDVTRNVTDDTSQLNRDHDRTMAAAAERCAKPRETFWLAADPLTGECLEPVYRPAIPVYDAVTGELREFLP